ncbi:MAG: beta-lactamase [Oxalobacteraceae bacterium]|nr:beta-lactamase [Oxalobacteraceae bacterium]
MRCIESPRPMRLPTLFSVCVMLLASGGNAAADAPPAVLKSHIDRAITPLMQQYGIPGMAVAVTINHRHYFFNYGIASRQTRQPVTGDTLFEIGSISKTLTATLAAYAEDQGHLALSDSASKYYPSLRGSAFDKIRLLDLGTHTSGGLPLQVPDGIATTDQLMTYFRNWQPDHAAGTHRTYSNPGIGLLGMIAAKSMNMSFANALQKWLFPLLGMTHSYLDVPAAHLPDYAQGYTKQDAPIRVSPGMLDAEAYGVKSTSADMLRFLDANLQTGVTDTALQRALARTHTGYFKAGDLTQDLIWEQYAYPVALETLLSGNTNAMAYESVSATAIEPPLPPQAASWINKTGSTNGFAAYVAFVPAANIGIVMLANKSYPVAARVEVGYRVMEGLAGARFTE